MRPTRPTRRTSPRVAHTARTTRKTLWAATLPAALFGASTAHAAGQLELVPEIGTLIALIIGFVLLSLVINPLIVQPVLRVLDERRDRIEGARRRADKIQLEADAVLARYEGSVREVREETERSRREQLGAARSEQNQIKASARAEADREIEASRRELAASLEQARASLRTSSRELASAAAERILGRALS